MSELESIINEQVDAKVNELATWKQVRYEGGRLYYECTRIINEISDYNTSIQISYLENLYKRQFIIQDHWPGSAPDITQDLKNWIKTRISRLKIMMLDGKNQKEILSNKIFIVHGHNNELKYNVARTVEQLGLEAIILHEQSNDGKTIIEKFEINSNVGFAIVLLTSDDIGKSQQITDSVYKERARQNVVFELGYFLGKLGRNRVFSLYTPNVELPSDIQGLLYTPVDNNGAWKMQLVKELKALGYNVSSDSIL